MSVILSIPMIITPVRAADKAPVIAYAESAALDTMKNNTDSPREETLSFIYVFLTFGVSAVYNMDSVQFDALNLNM